MHSMRLSNGKALVIKVEVSKLSAGLVFLLATIINKEIAEIEISFLIVLNIDLNNDSFYCSCNI